MPSVSAKQKRFMAAVAHSPSFAKKVGVPTSVGKEFNQADKESGMKKVVKKALGGGVLGGPRPAPPTGRKAPAPTAPRATGLGTPVRPPVAPAAYMARGGATSMGKVKTAAPSKDGIASKGKTKGKMVTMKRGGKAC